MTEATKASRTNGEQSKCSEPSLCGSTSEGERGTLGGTARYGDKYYGIKTAKGISENGEIYVMADQVEYYTDGTVIFWGNEKSGGKRCNLALAPNQWRVVFAASLIDGAAVAVEHWKGEVCR